MAINKRKILQSAQKHLQKGSLDRALKDYKTLLEADPRDVNVRLKIGDIHLRQGHNEEAVTAYLKVAEKFAKDGFDAKAVALYKQITKIDPKRQEVHVPLAELYQRLGLTSDAMKALQTAADAHYKDGDKPAALEVLRKMATLDPGNTTNRLKVAELLRQEGMDQEALDEYRECAAELERQGEPEGQLRVLEKVVELAPSDIEAWRTVGRANLALARWSGAEKVGDHLLTNFPDHTVEACELLAEAYGGLRKDDELPGLYRRMAEALRDRGDEDKAREILQRYVPGEEMAVGGEETPEPVPDMLFGDDALETDAGISQPPAPRATPAADPEASSATAPAPAPEATAATSEGDTQPAEDADAEQLFAEASVFRRYGKNDRAIESLRSILALEPQDRALLTKLGETFESCGAMPEAVEALSRAARCAHDQGDSASFATLCARVESLDPAAAQGLGGPAASEAAPTLTGSGADLAGGLDMDLDMDVEIDIDAGRGAEVAEAPAAEAPAPEVASAQDSIEIELDDTPDLEDTEATEAAPEIELPEVQAEVTSPGMDLEFDFEDDTDPVPDASAEEPISLFDDDSAAEEAVEAPAPPVEVADVAVATESPAPSASETPAAPDAEFTSPERISEALDEAAFYLQQGLYDESEAVYRRILESAPNHPQALLRLGEIEAARVRETAAEAEAPPTPVEAAAPEPVLDDVGGELELPDLEVDGPDLVASDDLLDEDEEDTLEPDAGADLSAALADDLDEDDQTAPVPRLDEAENLDAAADLDEAAEFEDSDEDFGADLAAELAADLAEDSDAAPTAPEGSDLEDALAAAAESVSDEPIAEPLVPAPAAPVEAPALAMAEAGESGDFDLAKELSGVFHEEGESRRPASEGTQEEGFESVFAAFKQGVDEALDEGDHEAHYDLGIAYKEMGLLDDAMNEFRSALAGEARRIDALHMLGVCALDAGQHVDAVSHLEQALALPEIPAEHQLGLRFDLGRAYQAQGDRERARAAWETVCATDPEFCDVQDHLAALDGLERSSDPSDFESFEDLVAEAEEEEDTADATTDDDDGYESFEDLMADAEDEPEADPPPVAAVPAEPEAPLLEAVPVESEPEASLPIEEPEPLDEPFAELEAEPEPIQEPEAFDEPEPEPEPDPAPAAAEPASDDSETAPKKKRRKKKISFV